MPLTEDAADAPTLPGGRVHSSIAGRAHRLNQELERLREVVFPPASVIDSMLDSIAGRERSVGGLGDRDRSLSPEGASSWETLLHTIAPDPQPLSVGSSFASTTASAVQSQSGPTGSSSTSLTGMDIVDEDVISFGLPCESGCEDSDTDSYFDDDDMPIASIVDATLDAVNRERRRDRRLTPRTPRSYADVVASALAPAPSAPGTASQNSTSTGDDQLHVLGGIGGMQNIVRSLARREDIPDEWWAEAGLSRTLPHE